MAVPLDVTDEASVIAAFDSAQERFGTVDTAIANAAGGGSGRSTDVTIASVRQTMDTIYVGSFLIAREAAKRLIANGSRQKENGRILFIGSITAMQHHTGNNTYAAMKRRPLIWRGTWRRNGARQGINVNVIHPGWIRTPINDEWFKSESAQADIARLPRRRMQEQSALDDMVLYLCSNSSRQVTGSVFTLDDGQVL